MDILSSFIALLAVVVSIWSLYRSSQSSSTSGLFGTFNLASQLTFEDPMAMRDIHGLPDDISDREARAIVTLNVILDGYQHYKAEQYRRFSYKDILGFPNISKSAINYSKIEQSLKTNSEYINRLMALPANVERWQLIKQVYYGSFDEDFVQLIDAIVHCEATKR